MVRILSITDVVTNSSSEVFVIKSTQDSESIREHLNSLIPPGAYCSGMGGVLDVYGKQDRALGKYWTEISEDLEGYQEWMPDDHLIIEIDQGYLEYVMSYLEPLRNDQEFWEFKKIWITRRFYEVTHELEGCKTQGELEKVWPLWESLKEKLDDYASA